MRTLDDIVPPSRRKESPSVAEPPPSRPVRGSRRSHFPYLTLAIVLVVIAASIGVLVYFSSAKIEITPNTVSAAVQNSFTANQSVGDLPYEIITAQKTATQSIASNGTKAVNTVASGPITIYNTQAKAQKLITNTRFATASGLIFRIHAPVTVPAGSASKPGSATATAYADQPGDSYNVAPTSFTVPGLAGTPQANQVYARSSTAMTGGASGTIPVVDSATESPTRAALIAALEPDLAKSLQEQIPAGYVLVPGAATTTYQDLAPAPSTTTGMVDLKEQGTATAIVFPNAALAKAIASGISEINAQNQAFTLSSVDGLKLTSNSLPDPNASSFTFTLSGTAPLVYTVDPAHIAAAVAGETRSAAEVALTNYPEVKRAIIVLRPFWRQAFPQDPSAISVVVDEAH